MLSRLKLDTQADLVTSMRNEHVELVTTWANANAENLFDPFVASCRTTAHSKAIVGAVFNHDPLRAIEAFDTARSIRELPENARAVVARIRLDALDVDDYDETLRNELARYPAGLLGAYDDEELSRPRVLQILRHGSRELTHDVFRNRTSIEVDPSLFRELLNHPGGALCGQPTPYQVPPHQTGGALWHVVLNWDLPPEFVCVFADVFEIPVGFLTMYDCGLAALHVRFDETFADDVDAWRFALAAVGTAEVPLATFVSSITKIAR